MKIKKECFGGRIGFYIRKKSPNISSYFYLLYQRKKSNRLIKKYINHYKSNKFEPLFISIETINRCNGTCPFCPCNIKDETREYAYMDDDLFTKIINDLQKIEYNNTIMLLANNEIFLDKKIIERLKLTRKKFPKAHIKIFTNGKLLTNQIFEKIVKYNLVDEMIINNYNKTMELTPYIKKIYNKYKKDEFNFKITINLRYSGEVLSNRANSSPNKKGKKIIKDYCLLPYTDININPQGNLLICCCDATEKTNLGNVKENDLIALFNDDKYIKIRKKMLNGRFNNSFCKYCDFNDVGTRLSLISNKLKSEKD